MLVMIFRKDYTIISNVIVSIICSRIQINRVSEKNYYAGHIICFCVHANDCSHKDYNYQYLFVYYKN